MKKFSFTAIGISIVIILNLVIAGFLAFDHHRGHHRKGHMRGHEKNEMGIHRKVNHRGDFKRNNHRGHHRMMKDLNLSEEQTQKMETLRKEQRERSIAVMKKISELRSKETDLQKSGKLDEAQMNALAAEFGQYQQELHLLKLTHRNAMSNLLTKEQKEQMEKRFKERRNHGRKKEAYKDSMAKNN